METTPDEKGVTIEWKTRTDQPFDNFTLLYCVTQNDVNRHCRVSFHIMNGT
jgi:hypothetical protein